LSAQIYKYKDENGKWQFTDRPPQTQQPVEVVRAGPGNKPAAATAAEPVRPGDSLRDRLFAAFNPTTPIETATLAAVSIETPVGSGSGFFISEDGYIVTNKHVIRPMSSDAGKEMRETIEERRAELDKMAQSLAQRDADLQRVERELAEYKEEMSQWEGAKRKIAEKEYQVGRNRWLEYKKETEQYRREFQSAKRALDSAALDFDLKASAVTAATRFKVSLKDQTTLSARLVSLGNSNDLALLKLDGFQTPYINLREASAPGQGARVFAIGSPLGLKDFVTSGVVTRTQDDYVITDTQVLPGNSGGPLVDEAGRLVGVNTRVLSSGTLGSELFGQAIPARKILAEFGGALSSAQ
jgi:V8-like Glu-specific endopeptidase